MEHLTGLQPQSNTVWRCVEANNPTAPEHTTTAFPLKERKENQQGGEGNPNPPPSACWVIPPLRQTAVSPDAAVLTANRCVLPGRFHVHVVQRGLPHHMMSPRKLQALLRLSPREQKKKCDICSAAAILPRRHDDDDDDGKERGTFSVLECTT